MQKYAYNIKAQPLEYFANALEIVQDLPGWII